MLFWAKRTITRALLTLLVLWATAYGLSALTGVRPVLRLTPRALELGALVWLVILVSDFVIHGALNRLRKAAYTQSYAEFAAYFRAMTPATRVLGGLVAGLGEEPLFRGILLAGLWPLSPILALLATAALFGAAHYVRPSLRLFAFWAAYQGLLLGAAYHLTGSLAAVMLAHALHDTTGFFLLARREALASQ